MSTALLLSGGMDSAALAYWYRPQYGVTIDYGQKASQAEIRAASAICASLEIIHEVIEIDCRSIGSGNLVGTAPIDIAPVPEWWPYRNQLLITLAAGRMLPYGIKRLLLGCVKSDAVHKDGTKDFIEGISSLLSLQEGGISVEAPAIELTSEELIQQSKIPQQILAWAHSCHVSNYACGYCRGCVKHYNTFETLGYEPY